MINVHGRVNLQRYSIATSNNYIPLIYFKIIKHENKEKTKMFCRNSYLKWFFCFFINEMALFWLKKIKKNSFNHLVLCTYMGRNSKIL